MLSKYLYDLSNILCGNFSKLYSLKTNFLSQNIIEQIYYKKLFTQKWRETLITSKTSITSLENINLENINFCYNYKILEQYSNFLKLKFTLKYSFLKKHSSQNIFSVIIENYILIAEKSHSDYNFLILVNSEEDILLYNKLLQNNISDFMQIFNTEHLHPWKNKLYKLDDLYNSFIILSSKNKNARANPNGFNANKAVKYAEKFALISNPNYKSFDGEGGDCTNFVSQILHEGGLSKNQTWKPYSDSWVRVIELYSYLMNNNIGFDVSDIAPLKRGNIIQFYTPQLGKFFHTGFITYELSNGDCLYCCHSYNKLNYPLSEIYPIIYPTLRSIKIE